MSLYCVLPLNANVHTVTAIVLFVVVVFLLIDSLGHVLLSGCLTSVCVCVCVVIECYASKVLDNMFT